MVGVKKSNTNTIFHRSWAKKEGCQKLIGVISWHPVDMKKEEYEKKCCSVLSITMQLACQVEILQLGAPVCYVPAEMLCIACTPYDSCAKIAQLTIWRAIYTV